VININEVLRYQLQLKYDIKLFVVSVGYKVTVLAITAIVVAAFNS
jgi:hypothetical protein